MSATSFELFILYTLSDGKSDGTKGFLSLFELTNRQQAMFEMNVLPLHI